MTDLSLAYLIKPEKSPSRAEGRMFFYLNGVNGRGVCGWRLVALCSQLDQDDISHVVEKLDASSEKLSPGYSRCRFTFFTDRMPTRAEYPVIWEVVKTHLLEFGLVPEPLEGFSEPVKKRAAQARRQIQKRIRRARRKARKK